MSLIFSLATQPVVSNTTTGSGSRSIFVNPGSAVRDWSSGNDSNDGLTKSTPLATLAQARTFWASGDTIKLAPAAIITEPPTWSQSETGTSAPNYSEVINFEGDFAAPAVFNAFDSFTGSWTDDGTSNNTYTTQVSRVWYDQVGSPSSSGKQSTSWRILQNSEQLTEVLLVVLPSTVSEFSTEAACLAYVRATPGTFYIQGYNGSCMDKGWQKLPTSTTETLYLHTLDNSNPNTNKISIGQRFMPAFNKGSKISNIVFFGGVGHNGVIWRGCEVRNCKIYYPLHHAQFCAAATLYDVMVYGGNKAHGGYAYHNFDANNANPGQGTRLIRCSAINYTGAFNSIMGGHGTDATTNPIIDFLEVDDFYGFNINNIGWSSLCKNKQIWNRPVLINCNGISAPFGDCYINDMTMVQGEVYASGGLIVPGSNGNTLTINNSNITINQDTLFASNLTNSLGRLGTINFNNTNILLKGDNPNNSWLSLSNSGVGTINFNSTILACDTLDEAYSRGGAVSTSGWIFNYNNCLVSGLQYNAGSANITANIDDHTVLGGQTGLYRDTKGQLAIDSSNMLQYLGHRVKKLASFNINLFGSSAQYAYALTSRDLLTYGPTGINTAISSLPTGVVLNTISIVKGASTTWVLLVGNNGAIYKMTVGGSTLTTVNSSRSKNWVSIVDTSQVDTSASGGRTWLLADDGSITEYVADSDTFTDRSSGVSFPLLGGFFDGTDLLVWGGNARGTSNGTSGGVLHSTDFGSTWAYSLQSTDTSPGSIGSYAYRVGCGTKVNSNWLLFGSKGTMLIGSKVASATGVITGNVLTISGTVSGVYRVGQTITGTGVGAARTITSLGTGTGGTGTYNVSSGADVTSTTITGTDTKISWTARQIRTDIDFIACRSDNLTSGSPLTMTSKKVLLLGSPNIGAQYPTCRSQLLVTLDTSSSSSDYTLWTTSIQRPPLLSVSDVALVTNGQSTVQGVYYEFILSGKFPEFARSEGTTGWHKARAIRFNPTSRVIDNSPELAKIDRYLQ
jgi:hypothetical protein